MKKYVILTPPPNLTGELHIGHIFNLCIQDYIVRIYDLFDNNTNVTAQLGFDHAGLSAEIIAKRNQKENSDILETIKQNNEEFLSKNLDLIREYNIKFESDSWMYTMSKDAKESIKECLSMLLKDGILYSDNKLLKYDISNKSVVSDLEIQYETETKELYFVEYAFEHTKNGLIVATTMPETIEADVCLVVNPEDERYRLVIGKKVINPITGKLMKVLCSKNVSKEYGTGVLKVTPIYDQKDLDIAKELGISFSKEPLHDSDFIMTKSSVLCGKHLTETRKFTLDLLKLRGHLVKIETTVGKYPISERSKEKIWTLMGRQTFIDMKKLVDKCSEDIDMLSIQGSSGKNELKRFAARNEDWCISRNNSYGHDLDDGKTKLDTWFSSALWIDIYNKFSQDEESEIIIITAYDILFFWIYRMFYLSQFKLNKQRVVKIIVHGLWCDEKGQKISKSKGNTIPIKHKDEEQREAFKLGILMHPIFQKRIKYSTSIFSVSSKILKKIINIGQYISKNISEDIISISFSRQINHPVSCTIVNLLKEMTDINEFNFLNKVNLFERLIVRFFSKILVVCHQNSLGEAKEETEKDMVLLFYLCCKILYCVCPNTAEKAFNIVFKEKNLSIKQKFSFKSISISLTDDQIKKIEDIMIHNTLVRVEFNKVLYFEKENNDDNQYINKYVASEEGMIISYLSK